MVDAPNTKALLLSRDDLKSLGIRYSNVHLLRMERSDSFPKRIYLSPHRVAWSKTEVVNWIEVRATQRESFSSHDTLEN